MPPYRSGLIRVIQPGWSRSASGGKTASGPRYKCARRCRINTPLAGSSEEHDRSAGAATVAGRVARDSIVEVSDAVVRHTARLSKRHALRPTTPSSFARK